MGGGAGRHQPVEPFQPASRQRPDRGTERAYQTVTGEDRGPVTIRRQMRDQRMFERQEDADIAAGRIDRADESHQKQRPEGVQPSEAKPRRRHQKSRRKQPLAQPDTVTGIAQRQRQQCRAQQGGRGDQADFQRAIAQPPEMHGKQKRHEPVGDRPQPAPDQNPCDGCPHGFPLQYRSLSEWQKLLASAGRSGQA